jgi:hypothetical protein
MGNLRRLRKQIGKSSHQPKPGQSKPGEPECIEVERSELEAILGHARTVLSQEEYDKLHAAIETLIFLTQELEKKHVSIQRLKQMLFGATTETTHKVMEKILDEVQKKNAAGGDSGNEEQAMEKAKGHGRNGAEDYTGAETVHVTGRVKYHQYGRVQNQPVNFPFSYVVLP